MNPADNQVHVLYLIDHLWNVGGAEVALLRTARLLPRDRYRCTIGTFRLRQELPILKNSPWPVVEFPLKGTLNAQALKTAIHLRRFIHSQRVDIVHTFGESANLWGAMIAKLSGCRVLISSRRDMGILRTAKHRVAYRLLNPFVDQVQAVSDAVRRWVVHEEALNPNKVVTVPNSIEIDCVDHSRSIPGLRRTLGLSDDSRLIVAVHNVRRVKGVDILIRTAGYVCHDCAQAVFLIAGSIDDPEYYEELKRLAEKLNVNSNVRFLGACKNVRSLLRSCEIFCLLSRSEGMSNALLEAMACELPCVVTAVGGNPEVVEDGENGFLVPSEDPATAAKRLLVLLNDVNTARKAGQTARRTIEQTFSAQRIAGEVADLYDRLLRTRT